MPQRPPEPELPGHSSGPGLFFAGLNNREGLSKPWFSVFGREKKDHFLVAPTHESGRAAKNGLSPLKTSRDGRFLQNPMWAGGRVGPRFFLLDSTIFRKFSKISGTGGADAGASRAATYG